METKEKKAHYRLIEGRYTMSESEFAEALDDAEGHYGTVGFGVGLVCGLVLTIVLSTTGRMLAEIIVWALT